MNHRRYLFTGLAALVGVAALLALRAGGQVPPDTEKTPPTTVEVGPDNLLSERTFDGQLQRVTQPQANPAARNSAGPTIEYRYENIVEQQPDGSVERRTFVTPVEKGGRTMYAPSANVAAGYGVASPYTSDPEAQKLMSQEQAAAQDARVLSNSIQVGPPGSEPAELKKQLREKLGQIFDLQQQRRTREIAKIEERLGKLKETLKKRDTAKDSIVDRRLETLTGGVDELGWEESFPTQVTPYSSTINSLNPTPVPLAEPRFAPPVAPRAGSIPNAVPPPAASPVAPPVPAAPFQPPATTAPAGVTPAAGLPAALPVPGVGR